MGNFVTDGKTLEVETPYCNSPPCYVVAQQRPRSVERCSMNLYHDGVSYS